MEHSPSPIDPSHVANASDSAELPRHELPFFIVGNPRSGTTLLRFILSSHSRIYIPEETGFVPHLANYVGKSLKPSEVERLVRNIGQMNHEWVDLVDDFPAFFQQLEAPTLSCVLDALYRRKVARQQAVRWGDKGPSYVRWIPQLDRIFPQAIYIHMIRDGRDSSLSAMKKWSHRHWYFDIYYLMQNWRRNIRAGQSAGRWLGRQRYLEIRYEELVTSPETTIRQICDFLGEQFEPSMLDHTGLARQLVGPTGHYEVERPVTSRSVGKWRQDMSRFEQKVAIRIAGRELQQLGYEIPDLPPWTVADQAHYARLAGRFLVSDSVRRLLYRVGWLKMSRDKARHPTSAASRSDQ